MFDIRKSFLVKKRIRNKFIEKRTTFEVHIKKEVEVINGKCFGTIGNVAG